MAKWRDAWWHHTVRARHHIEVETGRMRLRRRQHRRGDEPLQRYLVDAGLEQPWYDTAVDRACWGACESGFATRVLRCRPETLQHRPALCRYRFRDS